MALPFTRDQFLDVFAGYNESLWPIAIAIWLLTATAFAALERDRAQASAMSALLALQWAWSALAYHVAFFTRINQAAWLFAVLFLIEAALLAWYGIGRRQLTFALGHSFRAHVARALIAYALIYPALVWMDGHVYPRMPTFGLPCPTTILTIGFLLAADGRAPRAVTVIPVLWAAIGGSAALYLGIDAHFTLWIAGIGLTIDAALPRTRRVSGTPVAA
jgi:hypothetical protein